MPFPSVCVFSSSPDLEFVYKFVKRKKFEITSKLSCLTELTQREDFISFNRNDEQNHLLT